MYIYVVIKTLLPANLVFHCGVNNFTKCFCIENIYLLICIYIFNHTLAQDKSKNSEITIKPSWITLPSTANFIKVEDIGKIEHITSNYVLNSSSVSNSDECFDFVNNIFECEPVILKPYWTSVFLSPESQPTLENL